MGWLLLVAGALLLGLATWSTTALLRPAPGLDRAVTAGVVAAAGAAACVLAAGAMGLLHPGVVLALEAAWAAVATALAGPPRLRRPRLRLGAAVRAEPWTAALVALAALALAWQALVALVLPPFAYDANTYHLTIVATWLREAGIVPPDLSLCCAYYPATSELLFAWPVLLQGSDAIVDLVQLPFAALGGLAVAGIARTAGLPRPAAAAAAALYVLTPAVLAQAPTDYADMIVAGCVLAALDQLARYAGTGGAGAAGRRRLATGLVLGIKGTGDRLGDRARADRARGRRVGAARPPRGARRRRPRRGGLPRRGARARLVLVRAQLDRDGQSRLPVPGGAGGRPRLRRPVRASATC